MSPEVTMLTPATEPESQDSPLALYRARYAAELERQRQAEQEAEAARRREELERWLRLLADAQRITPPEHLPGWTYAPAPEAPAGECLTYDWPQLLLVPTFGGLPDGFCLGLRLHQGQTEQRPSALRLLIRGLEHWFPSPDSHPFLIERDMPERQQAALARTLFRALPELAGAVA